jgi:hypothetical protein
VGSDSEGGYSTPLEIPLIIGRPPMEHGWLGLGKTLLLAHDVNAAPWRGICVMY